MRSRVPILIAVAAIICVSSAAPAGTVSAESGDATVTASVDDSSVWIGESVEVTVTIDNTAFRALEIDSIQLRDATGAVRVVSRPDTDRIGPRKSTQIELDASIDDVGITELTATVEFEQSRESSQDAIRITARNPTPLVDLTTTQGSIATERTVEVTIGNPHDRPLTRIETAVSGPASVELANETGIVPTLPPGETRELTFEVRGVNQGSATFDLNLSFTTADGRFWTRRVTKAVTFDDPTVQVPASTAPVRLAGLDVSGTGDVAISGDVANTQDTALTGVLISFPDNIDSTDTRFVGSVSGGEFAPFNPISASVSSNRTTVPVEVSYTLDGTRYTTVFELPMEGVRDASTVPDPDPEGAPPNTNSTPSNEASFPVLIVGIGGAVALLTIVIGGVVYRRR